MAHIKVYSQLKITRKSAPTLEKLGGGGGGAPINYILVNCFRPCRVDPWVVALT